MTTIKTLVVASPKFEKVSYIEEILCLATLIANGELPPNASIEDSRDFFANETKEDCDNCPFKLTCLAIISNG